jgi:hypothetical protein
MKQSKSKRLRAHIAMRTPQSQSSADQPVTFTDEQRDLITVAIHEGKLALLNRVIDLLLQVRKMETVNA